jgi:hypothetical protein
MSRTVWFVAGAGAGVYAMTKARRIAEAFTPEGLADRLVGLSLGLHLFGEEVRTGMTEKENDLRQRMGLVPHGPPELSGPGSTTPPRADDSADREGQH